MNIEYIAKSYSNMKYVVPHKHDAWEVILNTKGIGYNYINGIATEFKPGSITICPPHVSHYKDAKDGFRDIYVVFYDKSIFANLKKYDFQDSSDGKIKNLLFMISNIYHKKEAYYEKTSELLLEAICNILLSQDDCIPGDPNVAALRNDIISNFLNSEYTIGHGMDKLNYCADYIRRGFKKEIGMTPNVYLNYLRIEHAKKILQKNVYTHHSISDIAYMSGFYDPAYFSRVFKKFQGVPPKQIEIFNEITSMDEIMENI